MDAFEPVRESAGSLHNLVVGRGVDASNPLALINAAAAELDLEVFWLPATDPALKGSRAVYDEQTGAVCCVNEGDDDERAELAAHEIGHAVLHSAAAECSAADIDSSQSTELAPVGLQRVEDYGSHERRELQANVFAREFLLPRATARKQYLEEKLTASLISERRSISKNLVRQQLLDSLLLPAAAVDSEVERHRPAADASQDRAAGHTGSAFQLQAGPGTGKTSTVVKKAVRLAEGGIDPSSILILTFSNRAAGELSERISVALPNHAGKIWIGTFHAFGLDLVRRYHDRLELSADPALFDRSDSIEILEETLPVLPLVHYRNLWDPTLVLREIVTAISRAKDELVLPNAYINLAERMKERATDESAQLAAEKALEVASVYELYEAELAKRKAVDFGDLILKPTFLLEEDERIRAAIQLRHRHVLVDEYQDVNKASARLLRAIAGDGRRLWVVGDARQSIYRFRGASSTNMTDFAQEYPDAVVDQLEINFRSSLEIVDNLKAVAAHMGASTGMLPLTFSSAKGAAGCTPQIRGFDTLDEEAEGIAASVEELLNSGVSYRDQAVLCRSNSRLNEIANALEQRGIPVLHLGSFFERDEIRDLLSLLTVAVDSYGDGLTRVGAMRCYAVPLQDVALAVRLMREIDGKPLEKLATIASSPGLSEQGAIGLKKIAEDLHGLTSSVSPWEFLSTYLLDRSGVIAVLGEQDAASAWMRRVAIWQLLNFVRDRRPAVSGLPIRRTLDRIRQLVLLAEERDLRQVPASALHIDAVRLMTVHGSKGLQFHAVHVPGLTVTNFPSSYRGQRCPAPDGMVEEGLSSGEESRHAHEMEEECLYFVAMSRAEKHLRLYLTRKQPNGNRRTPSQFLDWLSSSDQIENPAMLPLPATALSPGPVEVFYPESWCVTDRSLGTYEKCPRRFFYTYILGLGGARKPTAFTRTHACVYKLIKWLTAERIKGQIAETAIVQEFERIWEAHGPTEHPYAAEYHGIALRLVTALIRLDLGNGYRGVETLTLNLGGEAVGVEPDEFIERADGISVLRRIRTGRKRSDEYDRLEYTLYHLAGKARFGSNYRVEALHLSDELLESVEITERKVTTRRSRSETMLGQLASGNFPAKTDPVRCPRCPHFFICSATPKGPLSLA
ncbi:MAG: ATP-dependent helicase [Pyrinomonadaceae bacterium]